MTLRMRANLLMPIVAVIAAFLAACTYSGSLDDQFYHAKRRYAADPEKLPFVVAIVNNANNDKLVFSASGGGHHVNIDLGNALTSSLKEELSALFTGVDVIDDIPNNGKYQIYAFVEVNWLLIDKNELSGDQVYDFFIGIQLKDENLKQLIAKYADEQTVHYSPPASAIATSAVTGASLFLSAPVTIPLTTLAVGSEAKELLEATISKSIRKLGDEIVADGQLRDYVPYLLANRGPINSSAEDGSAEPIVPSKYDDFLNGVVVIATASGFGSGFVVSRDGYVVTNKHVVVNDKFVRVRLRSGQVLTGTVVDDSRSQDLALVKLSGNGFSTLSLSTGVNAAIGNDVLAIGPRRGFHGASPRAS